METIVAVVAHPDDVAACLSGTLLLLRDKFEIHVLCATRGERGVANKSLEEVGAIREKEEMAACEIMGAELTFLDRIDREVFADEETSRLLACKLDDLSPRAVFTLWPIDSHPDHSAVSELTRKALFLSGLEPELYYFPASIHSQTTQFEPDIYVDISSVMDEKVAIMRCHECQNTNDSLVNAHLDQCRIQGIAARVEYAEVFKGSRALVVGESSVLDHVNH